MKISVVIPALNEEKTIAICVRKALNAIARLAVEGEVIVVDNGSNDETARRAIDAGARLVKAPAKGYGSAVIDGFRAAAGEFLIMGDADDSYNFEEMHPFIEKLDEGYDFVIGNRFKGKIAPAAMPLLHRYLGTPALTAILNLFFGTAIGDANCGMRALRKSAFSRMHLKAAGMEFATEMVVKAALQKLKIAEVPCNLYKDKRGRKGHLDTWRDGWRHLRFMLLFAPFWTFLVPALTFISAGLVGMAVILARDIVSPDLLRGAFSQRHMISCMLLLLVGIQVLGMGIAAESFGILLGFGRTQKSVQFLRKHFALEKGIAGSLFLIFIGLATFGYLLMSYLGHLPSVPELLRFDMGVLASSLVAVGVQTVFTSFLLSLFSLEVKR